MKTNVIKFFILTQFCIIVSELVFAKSEPSDVFKQYLSAFEKQDLPLDVNSATVNDLFNDLGIYNKSHLYYEIKGNFKSFIPKGIIENQDIDKFYCQYLLPEYNDVVLVVIIKFWIDKYDNEILKQYIVTYKKNGDIIDYQEVSCVFIDVMEAVFRISKDYIIEHDVYEDVETENNKFYQLGTFLKYSITKNGKIELLSKKEQKGHLQYNGDFIPIDAK